MEVELPLSLLNDFCTLWSRRNQRHGRHFCYVPFENRFSKTGYGQPGCGGCHVFDATDAACRDTSRRAAPGAVELKEETVPLAGLAFVREGQLIEAWIDPRPQSRAGASAAALRSDHHPASPQRSLVRQDILRSLATSVLKVFIAEEADFAGSTFDQVGLLSTRQG